MRAPPRCPEPETRSELRLGGPAFAPRRAPPSRADGPCIARGKARVMFAPAAETCFVAGPATRAPLPLLIVVGSNEKSRPAPSDSPKAARLSWMRSGYARLVGIGSGLARLEGYPFEVRYSDRAQPRATAAADVAAAAYTYFDCLFAGVEPDIALIVADEADWLSRQPYGLAFFNDDPGQIRPGVVVMPVASGDFWSAIVQHLHDASPRGYSRLRAAYPDGTGGVDLQPFCDLITIHELGHAFETLGDLRLPTSWLSEIFVNLAMHAFVATQRPASLPTLEVLPSVGAGSRNLAARMRAEGYSTLEELETHYMGGDQPMSPLNYVWFQYRWQRLAARIFNVDGEDALARFWGCFHATDPVLAERATAASLAPVLRSQVSATLGRAVRDWR
jgi:hypothetical protein